MSAFGTTGHCRRAERCPLLGVKRPSLAALTKVPNPLEAEEEAAVRKNPSQNRRATSTKSSRPDLGSESYRIAPDRMFHDRMMIAACDALPSLGLL
jgi:hypothetical protein